MSTSAPAIGLPLVSRNQALTNIAGPGVGERTIEPPFGVTGECMRQNGPSRFCVGFGLAVVAVVEQADQR